MSTKAKTQLSKTKKLDHATVRAVVEFYFDSHVEDVASEIERLNSLKGELDLVTLEWTDADPGEGFRGTVVSVETMNAEPATD